MQEQRRKKILLAQLNSNGDCLYATTIARQIKHDYPNCHLTWAIGHSYAKIIKHNPDVDQIWEIPLKSVSEAGQVWEELKQKASKLKEDGEYDELFFTQLVNDNYLNFNGTIRSSIFNAYPNPITVPVAPVLVLGADEVDKVTQFAIQHHLASYKNVILFECSPLSGQAAINPTIAYHIPEQVVQTVPDTCIILSSNIKIESKTDQIIDGSSISIRENAELTKYC